jgi:hypothetical protein
VIPVKDEFESVIGICAHRAMIDAALAARGKTVLFGGGGMRAMLRRATDEATLTGLPSTRTSAQPRSPRDRV